MQRDADWLLTVWSWDRIKIERRSDVAEPSKEVSMDGLRNYFGKFTNARPPLVIVIMPESWVVSGTETMNDALKTIDSEIKRVRPGRVVYQSTYHGLLVELDAIGSCMKSEMRTRQ